MEVDHVSHTRKVFAHPLYVCFYKIELSVCIHNMYIRYINKIIFDPISLDIKKDILDDFACMTT